MRTNKILLATIAALGALAAPLAQADTATCSAAACSAGPLTVNFSINIPSVMRFTLGATGSDPTVTWTAGTITSANLGTGTDVNSDTVANGGAGANGTNQVRYALLSNLGGTDVTISATGTGGNLTSGGNTMPYSEIISTTTAVTGAAVSMPAAGSSTTVGYTAGLINRVGYWNYSFDNTTVYAAGTYLGSITYTATDD